MILTGILDDCFLFRPAGAAMYRPGSSSKPTSRSQSPPSPATLISINTVLESIKNRIERSEPLRMEAFLQLETSALATNNNPLINLIKDMVSTLKKSAAALNPNAAGSSDKIDPALVVCKCKFSFSAKFHFVFQNSPFSHYSKSQIFV